MYKQKANTRENEIIKRLIFFFKKGKKEITIKTNLEKKDAYEIRLDTIIVGTSP